MNFNEYQKAAKRTAIYPDVGDNLVYPVLGLNGEAGEVAEKVKKLIRDGDSVWGNMEFVNGVVDELGDVLWYIAAICNEIGITMNHVADINIAKLNSRAKRDVLSGSGDDR